ncbi:MAG: hypothetical protein ACRELE_04065 [Gemmatimonadales bacterium]
MRSVPLPVVLCWIAATATPLVLSSQAALDQPFLDSIIARARSARTEAAVPLLSRCDGRDPDVVRICQAAIAIHHGPLAGKREEVLAAEDLAVRAVFERDRWPYAWLVLGLLRLQLAHDRVLPHEGPLLPPGVSNELGGANALVEALELDPTLAAAANALAQAPEPREGVDALGPRVAMLRRVRTLLSPASSVGVAIVERDAGSVDSAVALERRALASGAVDSGVVLLSLARDLYRTNHPAEGRAALIAGAATVTDSGQKAYRNQIAWVASPSELARWDSLAPSERPPWLAGFWSSRDVADGRPDGDRLIEHYRRIEYAMAHFGIAGNATDRPGLLTFVESNDYVQELLGRAYASQHVLLCPESSRFLSDDRLFGADARERYFQPVQELFDDRGVVWIRQGPPTRQRQSNGVEAAEIWRYERPGGSLVVQFRAAVFPGATGVSVLVPSLLTISPGVRNQVCPLEPSLCSQLGVTGPIQPGDTVLLRPAATVGVWGGRVPPIDPVTHRVNRIPATASSVGRLERIVERCDDPTARVLEREVHAAGTLLGTAAILKARDQGRREIDLATTTDSYQRDFTGTIHATVQVFGLDLAVGGAPRIVVAYALPADDLMFAGSDSAPRQVVYPVRVQLMVANSRTGRRIDIDALRRFSGGEPAGRGASVTGVIEVPLAAGQYTVGVVFTQGDGRGATVAARGVALHDAGDHLAVSDLVLGRPDSRLHWTSGVTSVALNPSGNFPKGSTAEVYFQLSGLTAGSTYQHRFEFFRANDDPKHGPRLALSFTQPAAQARIEVSRSVDLKNLEPGRYRVTLTVSGDGSQATAVGWLTIVK